MPGVKRNDYIFLLGVTILVLVCQLKVYAQKAGTPVYPSVIGAAGGTHAQLPISLDWTVGEFFVESAFTEDRWYTQGFHQPFLSAKALFPSHAREYDIKIFPNPTNELLNIFINTTAEELLDMQLIDLTGKIIYKKAIAPRTAEVKYNLKHIPEGMYILSFLNPSGYRINSFKIIKL